MNDFTGKVVLISGSAGGQGRYAALAFAKAGGKVVGCDVNVERSKQTTQMVKDAGGDMVSIEPLDLSKPEDSKKWIDLAIATYGRIDVLYNNAAAVSHASFDAATIDDWDFTIRNELTICFSAAKAAWPHMKAQRSGVILNIASIQGHRELLLFPSAGHGAASAAVLGLTRKIAVEGAPLGIRCVSISPGVVAHDNSAPPYNDASSPEMLAICAPAPMKRAAHPREIVDVAMFLVSDKASYITGVDLLVDGGMSAVI